MMARQVKFTIPYKPKTKERPRMTRGGRAYTPKATVEAEDRIAKYIDLKLKAAPFDGPVGIDIRLDKHSMDVTITERKRQSKLRGDVDNYAKLVLDALQKSYLLGDDKQVVKLNIEKGNYK